MKREFGGEIHTVNGPKRLHPDHGRNPEQPENVALFPLPLPYLAPNITRVNFTPHFDGSWNACHITGAVEVDDRLGLW